MEKGTGVNPSLFHPSLRLRECYENPICCVLKKKDLDESALTNGHFEALVTSLNPTEVKNTELHYAR